jgi:chaperone modulatory protein CbpM
MEERNVAVGVVLEQVALSVDEIARACACDTTWIVERVERGLLECTVASGEERRFASTALIRARRLLSIERGFDADPELAALTVDLIEEVEALRRKVANARS